MANEKFPHGRLNEEDEGALALAVGTENGAVTIRFPYAVEWIAMTPQEAVGLAELMVRHAQKISTEPLTMQVGRPSNKLN